MFPFTAHAVIPLPLDSRIGNVALGLFKISLLFVEVSSALRRYNTEYGSSVSGFMRGTIDST
jgi:hypothetical protein